MPRLPSGTVTFLFTDIEGSTPLLRELGERYGEVLADHRRLLREAVGKHRGREVDCQGDALFAVFERAKDAVEAAAAGQRALATHSWPDRHRPRVRMGIHTGEPSVGDEGYLGVAVHHAARICAAAHGDQTLLSEATRAVLEDDGPSPAGFCDLGEHELKDMARAERIYQLLLDDLPTAVRAPKALASQPLKATPFAGQEHELAAAAGAAVGGMRLRVTALWRRLVSQRATDLGASLRLVAESVGDSLRSPLSLAVLVGLTAAAALAEPWIAALIPVLFAAKLSRDLRALRFHHGPEGVGLKVHALAEVAPDEAVSAELRSLAGSMVRGARLAKDVDRYLGRIDRGEMLHRLRELRESYADVRRADALAKQGAGLDDLVGHRRALGRETALLEARLPAIREALWDARIEGNLPLEIAREIASFSRRMRLLGAELDRSYARAREWRVAATARRRWLLLFRSK